MVHDFRVIYLSGEFGFKTKIAISFLYISWGILVNHKMSFNSSGGFRTVQPFGGVAGFYGGVDLQRGRDSDNYLDNPFTRQAAEERKNRPTSNYPSIDKWKRGFDDGSNMPQSRDSDDAFTRHAADQRNKHYLSENTSAKQLYKGFDDDAFAKRQSSNMELANRLRGCPETNRKLLDEYGRDGQYLSPPHFFANIPLEPVQRTRQGLKNDNLPDFGTLSLASRDRFYSARAAH